MPSIEVLIKLAKVFNVSVDFLIGEGELAALDKDLLKRIEDIEKLDEATKQHLFFLIDNVIQNYKTKKAFKKQQKPPNRWLLLFLFW
jgi:transcriptional regulator with XRE-family HTH domain